MKGVNKAILIGTLGSDPEVRCTPNGTAIANISLATNESWKDKQTGQQQEKTEWHRVVIFGKLAEIAGEYLRKGSSVYFEGKLQTRKWQDQATGVDKYTTEIVIDFGGQMQMLGGKSDNAKTGGYTQQSQPKASGFTPNNTSQQVAHPQQQQGGFMPQNVKNASQSQGGFQPQQPQGAPAMGFDDDIPFMRFGHQKHLHHVI